MVQEAKHRATLEAEPRVVGDQGWWFAYFESLPPGGEPGEALTFQEVFDRYLSRRVILSQLKNPGAFDPLPDDDIVLMHLANSPLSVAPLGGLKEASYAHQNFLINRDEDGAARYAHAISFRIRPSVQERYLGAAELQLFERTIDIVESSNNPNTFASSSPILHKTITGPGYENVDVGDPTLPPAFVPDSSGNSAVLNYTRDLIPMAVFTDFRT